MAFRLGELFCGPGGLGWGAADIRGRAVNVRRGALCARRLQYPAASGARGQEKGGD